MLTMDIGLKMLEASHFPGSKYITKAIGVKTVWY